MIRRHIPKGTNFDRKTKKDIQKVEDWLNNYPRPMFGGRSSQELYEEEMRLIINHGELNIIKKIRLLQAD